MAISSSRFVGPASAVDLKRLINRTLYLVWICLFMAVSVHTFFMVRRLEMVREEKAAKPLTVRFVQRRPRLTKPMEMRKRPTPRRRKMTRQKVEIKARSARLLIARIGGISMRSLAAAEVSLDRTPTLVDLELAPRITGVEVVAAKEPEHKIEMREQLLDLSTLDTGKYQAMVVQDPKNKRRIRGYFHIAQAYSPRMMERNISHLMSGGDTPGGGLLGNYPFALPHLIEALNEYTDIEAALSSRMPLSSKELMKTPWLFIPPLVFTLTKGELENLGRYMTSGGFIVADAGTWVQSDADVFMRRMIADALLTQGKDATFTRITGEHPIYHCFFDFDRPPRNPPRGPGISSIQMAGQNSRFNVEYMTGVEVDGHLVAVITYAGLANNWENQGYRNDPNYYINNAPFLQFGINLVVFALTQEGSITHRVMQMVE